VYSGSVEKLDFGMKMTKKGSMLIDIETDDSGKKHTVFQFHSHQTAAVF